jgi:hypothetical protein
MHCDLVAEAAADMAGRGQEIFGSVFSAASAQFDACALRHSLTAARCGT